MKRREEKMSLSRRKLNRFSGRWSDVGKFPSCVSECSVRESIAGVEYLLGFFAFTCLPSSNNVKQKLKKKRNEKKNGAQTGRESASASNGEKKKNVCRQRTRTHSERRAREKKKCISMRYWDYIRWSAGCVLATILTELPKRLAAGDVCLRWARSGNARGINNDDDDEQQQHRNAKRNRHQTNREDFWLIEKKSASSYWILRRTVVLICQYRDDYYASPDACCSIPSRRSLNISASVNTFFSTSCWP